MPRAIRQHVPGCVWHLTQRCHKRDFLLKFERDRERWLYWLFQAKKRYGLSVLNYIVTSNHIHLLVVDTDVDVISRSLQLVSGRTAQEYNRRKLRKGSFWEDRYYSTPIINEEHLTKCLVYIDLNMVRSGVVSHPSEYKASGYNELQNPPERYSIIDRKRLLEFLGFKKIGDFQRSHRQWVEEALQNMQESLASRLPASSFATKGFRTPRSVPMSPLMTRTVWRASPAFTPSGSATAARAITEIWQSAPVSWNIAAFRVI